MILYIGKGCPHCERVLDFMAQHAISLPVQDVWSQEKAYQQLLQMTGKGQVPCLQYDNQFMHESLDIIEKLKADFQIQA